MKYLKKLFLFFGMILLIGNTVLEPKTLAAYYDNDITPPWGRTQIEKSAKVDGTTYVGETPVTIKIYAKDDMCKPEEIKYYISTEPISNTTKLDTWYNYEEGKSHEISLSDDGTGKIYTIFKDANGNTSLTYEANANTSQTIKFDANGGIGVPTGINTKRTYGMPYILPNQAPDKEEYYFTGWSTDSKATVGSYRFGDVIPADISLGSDDEVTLYAIYGTDLSVFPDLVDVVEIGDYVDYPVEYENVVTWTESTGTAHSEYTSKLNGWRVLSKDNETGEVQLISAGVPLTLFKSTAATAQTIAEKMASTTEFLNIDFAYSLIDGKFIKNGFNKYGYQNEGLINAFTNKFTNINNGIPEVRSVTKDDIDSVYQYFNGTTDITVDGTLLDDIKYKELLNIPSIASEYYMKYWLATEAKSTHLWFVNGEHNSRMNWFYNTELGVRPVVTLKPNIKALGTNLDGTWKIETDERILKIPTPNFSIYDGTEQSISLNNFDSELMELSGITKATETGDYIATVSLKYPDKNTWLDGTTDPIDITWELIKDTIYVTLYTDGTLGFSNDESTIAEKTVSKRYGDIAKSHYTSSGDVPWNSDVASIKTVEFVNECVPAESTAYWFYYCKNLTSINNLSNLNTSLVTNMKYMFGECEKLTKLNLSNFDTKNVTCMDLMFNGCSSLATLNVSSFDTRNVTSMQHMFQRCKYLTTLDVSNFDTRNMIDMNHMFNECSSLTNLNVSSFDTRNVTNMYAMFANCTNLKSIVGLNYFDTKNVTIMSYMFAMSSALTDLNISSFDTSNVTTMNLMFAHCTSLKTIYVGPNWSTASADTTEMFLRCGTSTVTLK